MIAGQAIILKPGAASRRGEAARMAQTPPPMSMA